MTTQKTNIETAVEMVRAFHTENGHWPTLPSPFVETLPLNRSEIEEAMNTGVLRVGAPVAGPRMVLMAP